VIRLLALPLAVALVAPAQAQSFDKCKKFFINGYVTDFVKPPHGQLKDLCFDSFAVLYSGQTKTAVFVVERLNKAQLEDASDEERSNKFYEEARLPSAYRATLADYKGQAGEQMYDRGHMAPAGDMPNVQSMAQSFSLANMVPQASKNNRGPWRSRVEMATRKYVMRAKGDVIVFTGPVFETVQTLGPNKVWIPTHLFKLVYDVETGRSWAHWIENTNAAKAGPPITHEELMKRTGIRFIPQE
jgi:endonuclease G